MPSSKAVSPFFQPMIGSKTRYSMRNAHMNMRRYILDNADVDPEPDRRRQRQDAGAVAG